MSLITINNLTLSFGEKILFDKINFQVNKGDRVGLIGANGMGKTSFLRIITGEITGDEGEISINKGTRIGYLPQDILKISGEKLIDYVLNSVPGKVEKKKELEKSLKVLEETSNIKHQENLINKVAYLQEKMDYYDIHFSSHTAEQILIGLGFSIDSFETPVDKLSGGWKMRAALAALLYQKPDLLLLDEPTNNLDLPSVLWLDDFLANYNKSLILISHDRKFFNRHVNRISSLELEGLRTYNGNYDSYLEARQREEQILNAKARNQAQKVKEAKKFIDRFQSKSTKARQAQSKIKMLEKQKIVKTYKKQKQIAFKFPEVERSGDNVLSVFGLNKSFGDMHLYKDVDLHVKRGDRIAIVGKNGAGKTTLLRMLAQEIEPDKGVIKFGHNVTMSYYAQHHTELFGKNNTILDEVSKVVPNASISFIRGVCGTFLFSEDDVEKPISVLSGGEKARVALACILASSGNLIVMDEPTNHLDLASCEVMAKALFNYKGTLIFVSHNQWFVNYLAAKIWDVSDKRIEEYHGSFAEYLEHIEINKHDLQTTSTCETKKPSKSLKKTFATKDRKRKEAEQRNMINKELVPIKKDLASLEQNIDDLEKQKISLSKELEDPLIYEDPRLNKEYISKYNEVEVELNKLIKGWEKQQEMFAAIYGRLKIYKNLDI